MLCRRALCMDIPKTPTAFTFRIKHRVTGLLDPADEGGRQFRQLDVSADLIHSNTAVIT